MNRIFALLVGLALAVALTDVASAQETTDPAAPPTGHTSVDGQTVFADDDTNPSVVGGGHDLTFGDIDSGGVTGGTTTYVQTTPPDPAAAPADPAATAGTVPPPVDPAPPTDPATTAPPPATANDDGVATATDDAGSLTAPATTCDAFPAWLDAQLAFEAATDPALRTALDDDADGIACEHMMLTS